MTDYKVGEIKIHEGDRMPQCVLRVRRDGESRVLTTDDIFKGKKVVLFSLPGAFTSICSSKHLPQVLSLLHQSKSIF
jgi:peroxiredoxin